MIEKMRIYSKITHLKFELKAKIICKNCLEEHQIEINEFSCDLDFMINCSCKATITYDFKNLPEENEISIFSNTFDKKGNKILLKES